MMALRNVWQRTQSGNAILISLIIMASALTTSLGLASIVTGEIHNVALLPSSERGYYKSESYVEQALWEKNKGPQGKNYDVNANNFQSVQNQPYVCAANPCFTASPNDPDSLDPTKFLKRFAASSTLGSGPYELKKDEAAQFDIDAQLTSGGTASNAQLTLDPISCTDTANFKGIEVSIFSFPPESSSNFANIFTLDLLAGATPVFVDKILVKNCGGSHTPIQVGTGGGVGGRNSSGETYPSLADHTYRLRFKSLGSTTKVEPKISSAGNPLRLQSVDFTTLAVTSDGQAQRGVQVVTPTTSQIANVFDYVLFADLNLEKLKAKQPPDTVTPSIKAHAYQDNNRNCVEDGGDNPLGTVSMALSRGPTQRTNGSGDTTFTNLALGATYTVTAAAPNSGFQADPWLPCNGPQSATATANTVPTLTYGFQPPYPLACLYRYYNAGIYDHVYQTQYAGPVIPYNNSQWNYESCEALVYSVQAPGTVPLYRYWNTFVNDHYFTRVDQGPAICNSLGCWNKEGPDGYIYPYQPAGTVPLHEYWAGTVPGSSPYNYDPFPPQFRITDHFYTTRPSYETGLGGYGYDGVTGYVVCSYPYFHGTPCG